ncbi:hypothetical protein NWE59_01505 [Mycoplasmopsis felis]|uniref:p37/Cypl family ABC transporter substrate-binding protein n=1 Tax=Mycoplasmopsis felis TaxID=33923 RepID=UPI0021AECC54|nr:hypothetical protein [Mycoplasmopsis felis]UWV78769.1 hypothetical protein NWE59_01505 [Mycoplasmopsis felis]
MVILGSEEERNLIKKAWEDKNLEEFLKYGLVVGKNQVQEVNIFYLKHYLKSILEINLFLLLI